MDVLGRGRNAEDSSFCKLYVHFVRGDGVAQLIERRTQDSMTSRFETPSRKTSEVFFGVKNIVQTRCRCAQLPSRCRCAQSPCVYVHA